MLRRITVIGAGAVLLLLSAVAAPATAAPLSVPHNSFAGLRAEVDTPGGSAPGSNDFSCMPSPQHPRPVVLVHGTAYNRLTAWATMSPALKNAGYCVFAPTIGARTGLP